MLSPGSDVRALRCWLDATESLSRRRCSGGSSLVAICSSISRRLSSASASASRESFLSPPSVVVCLNCSATERAAAATSASASLASCLRFLVRRSSVCAPSGRRTVRLSAGRRRHACMRTLATSSESASSVGSRKWSRKNLVEYWSRMCLTKLTKVARWTYERPRPKSRLTRWQISTRCEYRFVARRMAESDAHAAERTGVTPYVMCRNVSGTTESCNASGVK
mmetsp:Transcript_26806/g.87955  ORF Transcript_26806/g.87955 Transcript_26806/m.87955 type:complete len:223 (-) Transcript_26806:1445-2113(-)